MVTDLDWLEYEIRQCYDLAVEIHNEPSRERYALWLDAIARIRTSYQNLQPRIIPREETLKEFVDALKKYLYEDEL